jgi:hypothetical protein
MTNLLNRTASVLGNQPFPRCIAAVEYCTHHIATVPSVRNAGVRESRALQVEPARSGSFFWKSN